MKCLLKTIIAIVVIVVVGGLLLWFVGFPAMLEQDKAAENLEKKDFTVTSAKDDDLLGAAGLTMADGMNGYVMGIAEDAEFDITEGIYNRDVITISYFDETDAAKDYKESTEEGFEKYIETSREFLESGIGGSIGSILGASVEALEELEKDYKIVRFGKIVVTGTVRNIVTAMIGL